MSAEFGQRVAEARQRSNLTQTQLANRMGRTRSTVANIEAGRQSPPIDQVLRIAQVLNEDVGWLLGVDVVEPPVARRASYLSPPDFHRLEWACQPIRKAFGTPPYLVGSALIRPDFRDIDLRLILADEVVVKMFGLDGAWGTEEDPTPHGLRLLLDIALSDLIAKTAGLAWPIDFQIQSMSEANVPEHGARNPMGVRS